MFSKTKHLPILIILFISLVIGIFTFQDYGMTWDENLYYQYGEAVGYAYSIPAHLSSDFDINRAYGPSVGDHKVYGPVYLLITRIPVLALRNITGLGIFSIWHLFNFITFLIGVYYLYRLALRWLKPNAAFWTTLLYVSQPLLWGHAFINPKDPPFATLFIITIYYGFKMVDHFSAENITLKKIGRAQLWLVILVGILIGIASNLRIIAPFIAVLIFLYTLLQRKWKVILWFIPIGIIAIIVLYITWPYLWDAPVENFLGVLARMSNNPTKLKVLFYGQEYRAYELPLRYLPVLLGITLTEPVWILFTLGFGSIAFKLWKKELDEWKSLSVIFFWFVFITGYILMFRPPMYDGFRHFFFILPPVFILAGFGIEQISAWGKKPWLNTLVILSLLFYGLRGIIALHPYEYAYYNQFIGGVSGAEGTFETEYWLTCYKESVEELATFANGTETLLQVYREPTNAAHYAPENIEVIDAIHVAPGDYLLLSARLNEVNMIQRKSSNIIEIGRDGATFCAIREIAP